MIYTVPLFFIYPDTHRSDRYLSFPQHLPVLYLVSYAHIFLKFQFAVTTVCLVSKNNYRAQLSLYSIVFQDVTLFNNTVMENIRIGKEDATDAEVIAAARLAHCDAFVEKLSNGYDTMIGENGSELSGGERQRIPS